MPKFEYKVVPAPAQGKRGKGAKGLAGRFANAMSIAINELAAEGWEYVRAESLPSNDRTGLTRKRVESFQNVLVFRRPMDADSAIDTPIVAAAPVERADPPLTEAKPDTAPEEAENGEAVEGDDDPDLREIVEDSESDSDVDDADTADEDESKDEEPKKRKRPKKPD